MAIYSAAVTAPVAFPAVDAPSFTIPFQPKSIVIINEDATPANYVEFSLEGGTNAAVHGKLIPTIVAGLKITQPVTKIWVRLGAGTPTVRIVAEQ